MAAWMHRPTAACWPRSSGGWTRCHCWARLSVFTDVGFSTLAARAEPVRPVAPQAALHGNSLRADRFVSVTGDRLMKATALIAAIGVGVLATALAAQPTTGLPQGWMQTGDAQTCEDKVMPATGAPSAKVFSVDCKPGTKGFSSLMQMIAGTDYAGKRVRLTAQVRGNQ